MAETALNMVQRYYPKVRSVEDAKKPLDVSVSKADCSKAKPMSFTDCAFANACKRAEADGAIITLTTAYIIKGEKAQRYKIGTTLSREITVLDRSKDGDRFTAQTYKLRPPTASIVLGRRLYAEKRKGRHMPTGKRAKPVHTEDVRHIRE
jgi:hypothetical protein